MVPDFRLANPYQSLLGRALVSQGFQVSFANFLGLRRYLLKRPAIIHVHWTEPLFAGEFALLSSFKFVFFVSTLFYFKILGTKIIWTVHNLRRHDSKDYRLNELSNLFFGKISSALFALSAHSADLIVRKKICASSKIKRIPHGHYIGAYPNDKDRQECRDHLRISSADQVFLFLGKLRPYKGLIELIRAFKKTARPNSLLIIAGKPVSHYRQELANEIGECTNILTFAYEIPNDQIQIFLNAADVVVLPYREILNSGSLWLAMSFGKCCIVPAIGSIPEIIDASNGIPYDIGPSGLESALQFAMDNETIIQERGRMACQSAKQSDWNNIGKATAETYRLALSA